jgi:hypothetical protein
MNSPLPMEMLELAYAADACFDVNNSGSTVLDLAQGQAERERVSGNDTQMDADLINAAADLGHATLRLYANGGRNPRLRAAAWAAIDHTVRSGDILTCDDGPRRDLEATLRASDAVTEIRQETGESAGEWIERVGGYAYASAHALARNALVAARRELGAAQAYNMALQRQVSARGRVDNGVRVQPGQQDVEQMGRNSELQPLVEKWLPFLSPENTLLHGKFNLGQSTRMHDHNDFMLRSTPDGYELIEGRHGDAMVFAEEYRGFNVDGGAGSPYQIIRAFYNKAELWDRRLNSLITQYGNDNGFATVSYGFTVGYPQGEKKHEDDQAPEVRPARNEFILRLPAQYLGAFVADVQADPMLMESLLWQSYLGKVLKGNNVDGDPILTRLRWQTEGLLHMHIPSPEQVIASVGSMRDERPGDSVAGNLMSWMRTMWGPLTITENGSQPAYVRLHDEEAAGPASYVQAQVLRYPSPVGDVIGSTTRSIWS